MRLLAMLTIGFVVASAAQARDVRRPGAPESPLAASAEAPPGSRIVWISGTVPDAVDPAAPAGSVERYGDTAAQARSVLGKIEAQLQRRHGIGLGDIGVERAPAAA